MMKPRSIQVQHLLSSAWLPVCFDIKLAFIRRNTGGNENHSIFSRSTFSVDSGSSFCSCCNIGLIIILQLFIRINYKVTSTTGTKRSLTLSSQPLFSAVGMKHVITRAVGGPNNLGTHNVGCQTDGTGGWSQSTSGGGRRSVKEQARSGYANKAIVVAVAVVVIVCIVPYIFLVALIIIVDY